MKFNKMILLSVIIRIITSANQICGEPGKNNLAGANFNVSQNKVPVSAT